ncbi:MAG TPA: type IX secretion system outer membrane channel protein PorV [Chitinophagaceae bacterium]|nr:type IX secretion system outer membrane channel protein PorV [Chitinophagaceae bacterium]
MMRSTASKLSLGSVLVLFFATVVSAQTTNKLNVVTTAVPFLRISPDARTGGMGDLSVATSPDANSGFYNLAKIPFNEAQAGVGVTYTPWLKDLGLNDVYLASLAGYYKFDENQAINASVRYFSLGNIQFTDNLGNDLNSFRPKEFGIDVGYSRKLSDELSIGVGLKYIYSNLAGGAATNGSNYKAGTAVAGDLGFYYQGKNEIGTGWAFGAALTNLGSKIAYTDNADQKDFIPANLGFGTTYTKVFDAQNKISFGVDVNKLLVPTPPAEGDTAALTDYRTKGVVSSWFSSFGDAPGGFSEEMKEFQVSVGGEYWYNNQFALRAGYFWEDATKGNRKYFTMGIGIKYNIFGLNFSYLIPSGSGVNRNPLSNTLRFSLLFDLDGQNGQNSSTTSEQ